MKGNGPTIFPWSIGRHFEFDDPKRAPRRKMAHCDPADVCEMEVLEIDDDQKMESINHDHSYKLAYDQVAAKLCVSDLCNM